MDVRDLAQSNHSFENMAVYDTWAKNVPTRRRRSNAPEQWVGLVPAAYFEILINPILAFFWG